MIRHKLVEKISHCKRYIIFFEQLNLIFNFKSNRWDNYNVQSPNIFQINPPKSIIPFLGHFKIFVLPPSAIRWTYTKPISNSQTIQMYLILHYHYVTHKELLSQRPMHSKFEKQHKIYSYLYNLDSQKKTTKALMLFLCKVLN